jgi:hypothetical protein
MGGGGQLCAPSPEVGCEPLHLTGRGPRRPPDAGIGGEVGRAGERPTKSVPGLVLRSTGTEYQPLTVDNPLSGYDVKAQSGVSPGIGRSY